ncbi:MAG TPA: hypothetical protein DCM45_03590 [Clostridiales bacterium]|nr:hypothetical protein [Clostridiales bacterium]
MSLVDLKSCNKGVSRLSSLDIERLAYNQLSVYNKTLLTQPGNLDIDDFAENYLGINLDFAELSNNGSILGMLAFSDCVVPIYDSEQNEMRSLNVKAGTALIDSTSIKRHEYRGRFTIAHECAHWLLHRPSYQGQSIICRKTGTTDHIDWLEWQADNFASALLMPAVAVHAFMKNYVSEHRESMKMKYQLLGEYYARAKREQIIRIAAITFGVSILAAEIRLLKLKYLKPRQYRQPEPGFECINPLTAKLFSF